MTSTRSSGALEPMSFGFAIILGRSTLHHVTFTLVCTHQNGVTIIAEIGHMEKQEMEMKRKLEMETGNGNRKLKTEMEMQLLPCCSPSKI